MSREVPNSVYGDPLGEQLRTLRITSLEDEDEIIDEATVVTNGNGVLDEYEDDDEDDEDKEATLGFLEKPKNQWSLLRHLFPSKAGGVPAWLDPNNLPSKRSSLCDICGEPLQFLLQVYATNSEEQSSFHRTLFVFMCPSMRCLLQDQHEQWKRHPQKASRSVKVFRCQLPRSNSFYSSEPPKHDGTDRPSASGAALCSWCGTWKGEKVCGSCRTARYCSEKHQAIHWRSGHKMDCQKLSISPQPSDCCSRNNSAEIQKVASKTLWPQFEIIHEDEPELDMDMSDNDGYANSLVSKSRADDSINSLVQSFEGDADKQSWASFQERIGRAPEQVLRYCRDHITRPLWPISSGQPSKADIQKCSYCGGLRVFEFQILPQLLYYFGVRNDVDSLDWAAIVVYTCEASCEGNGAYKEEFAWVQLASQSTATR